MIVIILINSFQNSHSISTEGKNKTRIILAEEVTFFNKASILKELNKLSEATSLEIDLRGTKFIDNDIIEIFEDFLAKQKNKNFEFKIISEKGEYKNPENLAELFQFKKKLKLYLTIRYAMKRTINLNYIK